jgi:hypothetical protein
MDRFALRYDEKRKSVIQELSLEMALRSRLIP